MSRVPQTSLDEGQTSLRFGQTSLSSKMGGGVAALAISATSIIEGATTGRVVGALFVENGSGSYTFTKTTDPDGKFTISGGNLVTAAALDYEAKTSHAVTVQASNGVGAPLEATFLITVINALEGVLAPATASFDVAEASGFVIATVTGFDAGANEVIASLSPNDGRLAFNNTQVFKGLSASSAGVIDAVITTSAGRTLNMGITVTEAPATSFKNFGALFVGGTDGLMIDLTDQTTLFQDANGASPVVNNGDPVGLALDQHKWGGLTLAAYRASQSELVTNGDFSGGFTGWMVSSGSGFTLVNSRVRIENDGGSGPYLYQSKNVTPGRWYEISVDAYTGTGAAKIRVGQSGSLGNLIDASAASDGLHRRFFKPTGTPIVISVASTGATGTYVEFDNISVKEIDGHHATQPGAAARPTWNAANIDVGFNGSSQFLATDYKAGATVNAAAVWHRTGVVSAERYFMGSELSGNYFMFGFNASGYARAYVGAPTSTINSTSLIGSSTGTLLFDKGATQTQVAVNGVVENAITHSGSMPTSTGIAIGCVISSGTPGGYLPGSLKRVIAVQARAQDTMNAADIHANLIAA